MRAHILPAPYYHFAQKYQSLHDMMLGGALAAILPPLGAWFMLFICVPLFYQSLIHNVPVNVKPAFMRAFKQGWCFAFGFFLISLYWMGASFLVEGGLYIWLMPFAVVAVPAGLALFYGAALGLWCALCRAFSIRPRTLAHILWLVLFLALADFARGVMFTGLPWNLVGMMSLIWLPLAQSADMVSIYGLTLFVWLAGFVPVIYFHHRFIAALLIVFYMALAGFGVASLHRQDILADASPPFIRIIQPNIAQKEKWQADLRDQHIDDVLRLTAQTTKPVADFLIWPETAIPVLLGQDKNLHNILSAILPPKTILLAGSVRHHKEAQEIKSYNSLFAIQNGQVRAIYDKYHLVPFGEYLPLQSTLEALGLRQLTKLRGGFTAGNGARVININNAPPFVPFICYEVIFPDRLNHLARPRFLVNITNDGWFGATAGPYQHLALAQMRAIEERLPLIRAANTGVSAIISAYGEIMVSHPLGEKGVIEAHLPPARPPHPLGSHKKTAFFLLCSCLFLTGLAFRRSTP